MRYVFLILLFVINAAFAQDKSTNEYALDERFQNLGIWEEWKFQAGDNLDWASPDFDDRDWIHLKPAGMEQPIPDSLWQGYGWFRLTFEADSSMYNRIWNLYFYTWGAAEVYIDGRLLKSYGNFSSNPSEEVRYMPEGKFQQPILLTPKDDHVIAVRYSYHKGPRYQKLLGKYSGNFGFGIGFSAEDSNRNLLLAREYYLRAFYISSSMLVVILFLLALLIFFMPHDRSNYYVATIIFLLLLHSFCAFSSWYLEMDALESFIISIVPFTLLGALAFSFFPLALSVMFNQKQKLIYKLVIIAAPLLTIIFYFFRFNAFMAMGIFGIVILVFTVSIIFKAVKDNERGVWFITFGFIGSLLGSLSSLFLPGFVSISLSLLTILITIAYVSIPLGMALFTAYRYYLLNVSLETKVLERTAALNQSLENLKSTQAQLIQSEKMASLGELTAGIAHEIQNPLNFVNNFSEVSVELVDEIQDIRHKTQDGKPKSEEDEILEDIRQNLEKIHHHGKRADAIVKGMPEHSRTSTGEKVPTDINALAEEYLRLSYHACLSGRQGMRAKDKSFNAEFKTDLDPNLPKVEVVPQDIGRVLLNIINNAFQAVGEKDLPGFVSDDKENLEGLHPLVTVSTKSLEDKIQITISDNGPGIPDTIKEKIFQPFFTTKPTGQGTGLGLSLSYDIVKAHGGEINLESQEGVGTTFYVSLPIS